MDLTVYLHVLILGIIEGLTEFLPVSSTGHLIIFGDLLGFTGERAKSFEIFIQLGAVMGVLWYYRRKVMDVLFSLHSAPSQRFALNIAVAFLPAAVIGLALHGFIKAHLFSPITVAGALVVGGLLILIIERMPLRDRVRNLDDLSTLDAFKVGIAQCFAMFPGVSRSGATIMGGLLTGLSRPVATEFSFFLAMPTMFAATLYDLWKSHDLLQPSDAGLFATGFLCAFLTALVVVRLFLNYVGRHNFAVFAWYRIVFGLLVLAYFW